MKYKPMPFPRLGSAGPCTFWGVVDIGGKPYAVWNAPEFDDRNNRTDAIHLIEFELEDPIAVDVGDGGPPILRMKK